MLALGLASSSLAYTPMRLGAPQMQDAPVVTPPLAQTIGDYGFDPLNLGTDETFVPFREAEIKHGRLAMLAAVAWVIVGAIKLPHTMPPPLRPNAHTACVPLSLAFLSHLRSHCRSSSTRCLLTPRSRSSLTCAATAGAPPPTVC